MNLSLPVLLTLLICGGLIVLFVSHWANLRRKSIWERFARSHRLTCHTAEGQIRVEGAVDGRPFRLVVAADDSDTGMLGIQGVLMRLGLHGALPAELGITQGDAFLGEVHQLLLDHDVRTGDVEFDRSALVKGSDPRAVVAYLDDARRAALMRLLRLPDCWDAGLRDGEAFIQSRSMTEKLPQLRERLRLLREVAPALDGDSPS